MKNFKFLALLFILATISVNAQKNKAGTVFSEHPAIDAVEAMQKAFVAGDSAKVATYLADNFRAFNGSSTNPNAKGSPKKNFVNSVIFWKNNIDYFDIVSRNQGTPDAIEYKDGALWVQTWELVKGVHNETGVKFNMPFHRLFLMNEDNKIQQMVSYFDESVYDEIGRSFDARTNGKVYDSHKNINSARRMYAAFENQDLDKAFSFFDENARIRNVNMTAGETLTIEEDRAFTEKVYEKYKDINFEQVGYPDYVHYVRNDSGVVQIWFNLHMTRKSDNKKFTIPYHALIDFNEEGKITSVSEYYSEKMME